MNSRQRGETALFSAALLYGFFGVFSKIISFQLPIFYQSWVRNVFAIIFLGAAMVAFKKWKPVRPKDHKWFFLRSAAGFVSYFGMYVAFTGLDIGTTYFLNFAASVIAGYLLGILVFKEKLTKYGVIAFVLTFIGLFFVYHVTVSAKTLPFVVLAIISGLAGPGWNAFSKKVSSSYSNLQLNFIDFFYAAAFPFIISIGIHEPWVPITLSSVWIATFLFVLMFIINGSLIVYGFSKVQAQTGIIILLFEVLAGIVLGYAFFHEAPSLGSIIGGCFILGAILLRTFSEERI